MSKLPSQKRILKEDIKDAPSWIDKIITPLNVFMEVVWNALNKNLTFEDNFVSLTKEVEFTTLSTYSSGLISGFEPIKFKHNLKNKPTGVLLTQILLTNDVYGVILNPVTINWIELNGEIIVNYITGLDNEKTYTIRLLVF